MFQGWENVFVLMGTAAAGLIGLLFVVVTLTAGFERSRALHGSAIYMTPTGVHFAVVLTVSAIVLAPRLPAAVTASLIGLAALAGFGHALVSCRGILEAHRSNDPPHWTDFWCYGAWPAITHLGIAGAAIGIALGGAWSVHGLAALLLMLLLVAIRNAWDLITWISPMVGTDGVRPPPPADEDQSPS